MPSPRFTRRKFALPAFGLALAGCARPPSRYPSREVRLIVQASPGGLSDSVSRITAGLMEKRLGVPVVCENKPGAAGALAFSYMVRQPANGYIFGHAPVEIAMVRTLGFADIGPQQMDLLCLVSKTQAAVAVHVDSPWRTLDDFLAAARARPGYYVMGNSGTGSIWHVNALLLQRHTGVRIVHCPFNGSSGSLTSLLGRHLDTVAAGVGEVAPHVQAGRMRMLAILDKRRSPLYPGVPCVSEAGFDFGAPAWSGFSAPKGLPPEVRQTLAEAIHTAFDTPEFRRLCEDRGMDAVYLPSDEFREFALAQAQFFQTTIPMLMRETA